MTHIENTTTISEPECVTCRRIWDEFRDSPQEALNMLDVEFMNSEVTEEDYDAMINWIKSGYDV